MDVQLKRGLLEACVLASLCKGDSWGYNIVKEASPHIDISESTLYPILRRLETAGSLSVYTEECNSRLRKYYKITPEGRNKLRAFISEWSEVTDVIEFIKKETERCDNDKN